MHDGGKKAPSGCTSCLAKRCSVEVVLIADVVNAGQRHIALHIAWHGLARTLAHSTAAYGAASACTLGSVDVGLARLPVCVS